MILIGFVIHHQFLARIYVSLCNIMDWGFCQTYPQSKKMFLGGTLKVSHKCSVQTFRFLCNIYILIFIPQIRQGLKLQNIVFVHMFPTQKCIFWLNSRAYLFNSKTKLIFSVQIYFFVQYHGSRFLSDGSARGWGYKRRLSHPSVGQSWATDFSFSQLFIFLSSRLFCKQTHCTRKLIQWWKKNVA